MNHLVRIVPLPATTQALLEQSRPGCRRKLLDYVDDILVAMYENPDYRKLLEAVDKSHTVEGSVLADHYTAATRIRAYAEEHGISQVQFETLHAIGKALTLAMRRHHISRKERKLAIEADYVPGEPAIGADYVPGEHGE